jgi:hypothetical protein
MDNCVVKASKSYEKILRIYERSFVNSDPRYSRGLRVTNNFQTGLNMANLFLESLFSLLICDFESLISLNHLYKDRKKARTDCSLN